MWRHVDCRARRPTSFPAHLFAIRGRQKKALLKLLCGRGCTWTPYKIEMKNNVKKKKLHPPSKKIRLASEYYYTCAGLYNLS